MKFGQLLEAINLSMANSISKGNYTVQVSDEGNDELSELTRSLNHMAKMVEKNISLLQRKNQELDQLAYNSFSRLKGAVVGKAKGGIVALHLTYHLASRLHRKCCSVIGVRSRPNNFS